MTSKRSWTGTRLSALGKTGWGVSVYAGGAACTRGRLPPPAPTPYPRRQRLKSAQDSLPPVPASVSDALAEAVREEHPDWPDAAVGGQVQERLTERLALRDRDHQRAVAGAEHAAGGAEGRRRRPPSPDPGGGVSGAVPVHRGDIAAYLDSNSQGART